MAHEQELLSLPVGVTSQVDVSRLLREVQLLGEFLSQSAIREPGTPTKLPRTGRLLDDILNTNKLNILLEPDRESLEQFLTKVKNEAPVLHMSFSADPSPLFTQKLITWLRAEIHPTLLLQTGLQPNIGAGCIVRTNNRYFDFSLRQHFMAQRDLLVSELVGSPSK